MMMGWEKDGDKAAFVVAWFATIVVIVIVGKTLVAFLDFPREMGFAPGTAAFVALLAMWVALRQIVFRPTYDAVHRKALKPMREYPGKYSTWMLLYK